MNDGKKLDKQRGDRGSGQAGLTRGGGRFPPRDRTDLDRSPVLAAVVMVG